ncbi:peroxiredoxin family protein [Colwellia piezophila]|uniref:peroxiredoxin family protein n=1 Tax=Colwellia piezophila TaxID=211668 RepID=UPI00047831F6|nr:peroxiredoxin family protein [Colwellia piezophila]
MNKIINFKTKRKIRIVLLSLLLLLTNKAFANTSINVGPTLGKQAPAITAINTLQQLVNIKQLSGEQGLIILFFRSADWCPFCKRHLIELNNQAEDFIQLGYGLSAISYDNTDILKKFSKQQNISFPLLSDQNVQTMSAYNILNKEYSLGDDNYGIPYPGVVVIDNQGNVIHKHFFKGYKKRVKFNELYRQLKKGLK